MTSRTPLSVQTLGLATGAATLLLALGASAAPSGGPTYEYLDLGTLGGGESVAYGLNDLGQVVGWSTIPACTTQNGLPCRMAYVWQDGVMTALGKLPADEESFARAINNFGLIVGTSESDILFGSGTFHGVRWDGGAISPLPDLGNGTSFAHDVNESGVIAGHSLDTSVMRDRAVTWNAGAIHNLGATEGHSFNRGYGLNDAGVVVGFAWDLFQPNDSILYDNNWFTIGGIDGPFQNSEVYEISNTGYVVGLQAFPSGSWHGAYWEPFAAKATDAGTLPGHDSAELYDVNDLGVAVGRSYDGGAIGVSSAVLFDGKTLFDLNDYLPAGVDAHLYEAREINEFGDVAGTAVVDGKFRAFLMRLEGPFEDLGFGLAGAAGEPVLTGEGTLQGGTFNVLHTANAQPGALAWYVLGTSPVYVPFAGGTIVPLPEVILPVPAPNPLGETALALTWPAGLPAGLTTYWQTWVLDASGPEGITASNGLSATTP